jgi:hypothetical protein
MKAYEINIRESQVLEYGGKYYLMEPGGPTA